MKQKIINFYNLMHKLINVDENTVLVFQMGKVGSSSIERALVELGVNIIHLHKITNSNVYFYNPEIIDRFKRFRGRLLHFFVNMIIKRKKCKVITIVRDPMSRTLSQMFHHLDLLIYTHNKNDSRNEVSAYKLFQNIFLNDININYTDQWMNHEFNRALGVEYLHCDFNKELGYGNIDTEKKKILILRFESLNQLESVVAKFVGLREFKFSKVNRAKNKWYGDLYGNFKSEFKVSNSIFNKMYETGFYRKFYGESSLEDQRDRLIG